jgi:hypothetical protein
MRRFCRFSLTIAIVLAAGVLGSLLQRQAVAAEAREAVVNAPSNLADIVDPAFERYADYGLLLKAYSGMNPELLTDAGLQLAEGERILLRPHKAFPADAILSLAVKAAAEKKDKAALDRLAKVAEKRDSAALKSQIAAAQKLGGQSRAIDPALMVSVDEITPEQFLVFQELVRELRRARTLGDRATVEKLAEEAKTATLPEKKRDYLVKSTSDCLAAMPKERVADPVVGSLDKLVATSRGWNPHKTFSKVAAAAHKDEKKVSNYVAPRAGAVKKVVKRSPIHASNPYAHKVISHQVGMFHAGEKSVGRFASGFTNGWGGNNNQPVIAPGEPDPTPPPSSTAKSKNGGRIGTTTNSSNNGRNQSDNSQNRNNSNKNNQANNNSTGGNGSGSNNDWSSSGSSTDNSSSDSNSTSTDNSSDNGDSPTGTEIAVGGDGYTSTTIDVPVGGVSFDNSSTSDSSSSDSDADSSLQLLNSGRSRSVRIAHPRMLAVMGDPAFNPHIDVELLTRAVDKMDPSDLTDLGLQLAEGERVLLRPHKTLPADEVLSLALRAAIEKNDKPALDRLAKVAEKRESAPLKAEIAASQKLGGLSRAAGGPKRTVSLDGLTPAQFQLLQSLDRELTRALMLRDRAAVERVAMKVSRARLPENKRRELEKDIANDLKQMPKETRLTPVASTFNRFVNERQLLEASKLASPSRSPGRGFGGFPQHGGYHPRPIASPPYRPAPVTRPYVDFIPSTNPQPISVTISGAFQGGQGGWNQGSNQVATGYQDAGTTDSGQSGSDQMAAAQTDTSQTDNGQTDNSQTDSGQTDSGQGDNQDTSDQGQ